MSMFDRPHWTTRYLGWDYEASGRCFGFFLTVQEERFGRRMPIEAVAAGFEAVRAGRRVAGWQMVDRPLEGDAVMMAHLLHPRHIGIFVPIDGGSVLHCARGAGSSLPSVETLLIAQWRISSCWRPAEECR